MKQEDRYHRFVRWSDADSCYPSRRSVAKADIGYCPDIYLAGVCHSDSEEACYADLCSIVRDEIQHRTANGTPLPEPTVRITKDLDFAAA